MSLARLVAEQLRQPSGLVGRAFGVILNRANRRINRRVVERLDVHPGQRVLEIGFGGGLGLDRLLDQGVGFAAGVEISEPTARLPAADVAGGEVVRESVGRLPALACWRARRAQNVTFTSQMVVSCCRWARSAVPGATGARRATTRLGGQGPRRLLHRQGRGGR